MKFLIHHNTTHSVTLEVEAETLKAALILGQAGEGKLINQQDTDNWKGTPLRDEGERLTGYLEDLGVLGAPGSVVGAGAVQRRSSTSHPGFEGIPVMMFGESLGRSAAPKGGSVSLDVGAVEVGPESLRDKVLKALETLKENYGGRLTVESRTIEQFWVIVRNSLYRATGLDIPREWIGVRADDDHQALLVIFNSEAKEAFGLNPQMDRFRIPALSYTAANPGDDPQGGPPVERMTQEFKPTAPAEGITVNKALWHLSSVTDRYVGKVSTKDQDLEVFRRKLMAELAEIHDQPGIPDHWIQIRSMAIPTSCVLTLDPAAYKEFGIDPLEHPSFLIYLRQD